MKNEQETLELKLKDKVFLVRVNLFFGHAGRNIVNGLLVGGVLICSVLYFSGTSLSDIAIWYAALCIASAITFFVDHSFKKKQLTSENANRWLIRRILAGSLIGLVWGISPFLLSSQGGFEAELVLFILLSTLVVIASIGYTVMPSYYLILNIIVLWPITISFCDELNTLHIAMIITSILWQVLILSKALIVTRSTNEALVTNERLHLEIAERIKVENALRESEERLELAIETSQIGLYDWDFVTGDAFFDENWMKMLGYDHYELPHNFDTWGELIHPDDKDMVLEQFNAHLEGKTPYMEVVERLKKKNGEWFWILDRAKVIQRDDTGKPLRVLGTHLDINQRKLDEEKIKVQNKELLISNEKLIELDQFKEGMTGMIVHDLKNPLNSILNTSDISTVQRAGKQMLNMVMNILEIQKLEETDLRLHTHSHSLHTISQSAMQEVSFLCEEKNIKITRDNRNLAVDIDEELVERVFVNLLTNAIKYTPNNGAITLKSYDCGNNFIKTEISDTGVGIPKDKLSAVFDKFVQLGPKKTGLIPSTGLGLTYCKLVIETHGGQIGVESELEDMTNGKQGGSTFWFTLPTGKYTNKEIPVEEEIFEEKPLELTDKEKELLRPFLSKLKELEVYESSDLEAIIKQIDFSKSENLKKWKFEMDNAVYAMNQEKYIGLIKLIEE